MLRAFLVVWTLVAGLAAGSLMYLVGGHTKAPVIAEQVKPARERAAAVTALTSPANPALGNAVGSDGAETPVANQTAQADAGPATTGSIATRAATRPVRRVDDGLALPPLNSEPVAKASPAQAAAPAARNEMAAAGGPETVPVPPARPAQPPQTASARETVPLPLADDAEADPAAPRARATASLDNRTAAQPPAAPVTTAAPVSPPVVAEKADEPARVKPDVAARPRQREAAVHSAPNEASVQAEGAQANRALKQQARMLERRAARQAAREAARRERQAIRSAAAEPDARPTARPRPAEIRRQARMERGVRVARGDGSLERLLDEFSRSGDDYLHERTIRVGTRYLVERTTRHGTQYFYEGGR